MADYRELRGSAADLAPLIKMTYRNVCRLIEAKTITKQPEGDLILPDAIAEYYKYKYKPDGDLDLTEEKTLHERVKRQITELELARRRGEVHDAADVELVMTDMLTNLRANLLAIPAKMAGLLANRDQAYIARALEDEIQDRLTELSDYSPELFEGAPVPETTNAAEDD